MKSPTNLRCRRSALAMTNTRPSASCASIFAARVIMRNRRGRVAGAGQIRRTCICADAKPRPACAIAASLGAGRGLGSDSTLFPGTWPAPATLSLRDALVVHQAPVLQSSTAPNPAPVNCPVAITPFLMRNSAPGIAHPTAAFAAGTYWRAFASIAATPGTWAAKPAE